MDSAQIITLQSCSVVFTIWSTWMKYKYFSMTFHFVNINFLLNFEAIMRSTLDFFNQLAQCHHRFSLQRGLLKEVYHCQVNYPLRIKSQFGTICYFASLVKNICLLLFQCTRLVSFMMMFAAGYIFTRGYI